MINIVAYNFVKMEDRTGIAGILLLYLISLSVILSFKGLKYDLTKKGINKNAKDHFGNIIGGGFHIALPFIIKEETSNFELNSVIKQYNRLTRVFWISVIISIPIFFWIYN